MITLYPDEKILIVVHKHWIAYAAKIFIIFLLLIAPLVAISAVLQSNYINQEIILYIRLFVSAYLMILVLLAFIFWMDHYLDVWIITNERIIDVEQLGIFRRETSEFGIDKVQDITVEVPNAIATFLRYGNLRIQTAGERSFTINGIPNIYEIKKIIMDEVTKKQHVGA